MQLILLDKVDQFCALEGSHIGLRNILISPNLVQWRDCSEGVARQIICETFDSRASCLDISLQHQAATLNRFKLYLKCTTETNNLLRKLRERYHDNISISVGITDGDIHFTTEEMLIHALTFQCESSSLDVDTYILAMVNSRRGSCLKSLQVTIIAHISMDSIGSHSELKCPIAKQILEECLFSDVVISTGSGTEVKAHKCFLAAVSAVLRKHFESGMKESQTITLDMTNMSEKSVRAFLRFIYCDELEEHKRDIEIAYELFCAAHKYDIPTLEVSLRKYLQMKNDEDFTVELAFSMYTYLRTIESATELKAKAVQILISNVENLDDLAGYNELFQKAPDAARELCTQFANVALKEKAQLRPQQKVSIFQKLWK